MSQTARQKLNSEREVLTKLHRSRWVSMFWLTEKAVRHHALTRMEKRGDITAKVMDFPMYRVTIHRKSKGVKQ